MKRLLKLGIGCGILALLVWMVEPHTILDAVQQLTIESVVVLLAISFVLLFVSALKWKFFIEALGSSISVWRLCNLYLVGYFVNTLVPSWVGGDIIRSWYIGKRIGQHDAFAATILERCTGLLAMLMLAFVAMWFSPLVTWQIQVVVATLLVVILGILSVACFDAAYALLGRLPGIQLVTPHLHKIRAALAVALRAPGIVWKSMVLSVLYHVVAIINTATAGWAVGWENVPLVDLSVVVPLILLIGAIPIAPSGLGIQEGAFYFFLTGIGASPGQAIAVGLVLRAKVYLLGAIGWFSWQYERRYNREFMAEALRKAGIDESTVH